MSVSVMSHILWPLATTSYGGQRTATATSAMAAAAGAAVMIILSPREMLNNS